MFCCFRLYESDFPNMADSGKSGSILTESSSSPSMLTMSASPNLSTMSTSPNMLTSSSSPNMLTTSSNMMTPSPSPPLSPKQ